MATPFTDEQLRLLVNLDQQYRAWIDAERELAALPYDLRRKEVGGHAYLYQIVDRSGNGTSLGAWSSELDQRLTDYRARKASVKQARDGARAALDQTARLYRALRLPLLSSEAGAILREADKRRLLDGRLMVVGTNALPAYALEAQALIDAPDETLDFDMAWSSPEIETGGRAVWDMLKAVDATFAVNTERPFQARNAKAYEVELLVAPSRAATQHNTDQPRPVALPEQEWLLEGQPVDQVLICRDGTPARVVAPDPRWFGLHKLWLAEKSGRDRRKIRKDEAQGRAVLNAVAARMPHYPLDATFEAALPTDLCTHYENWSRSSLA